MIETKEGALQHEHSLNHALGFFSKAGSIYDTSKKQDFYEGQETCLSLFQKTWIVDQELSMRLLFWLRDCRGGAGNRSGFRACLRWLCEVAPGWVQENIHLVPAYDRFDDLRIVFGTPVEKPAASFWADCLKRSLTKILAAKWADRKDKPLRHEFRMNEADFRRFLAKIRSPHIVEHKMCSNLWQEIEYKAVPSVAMSRYTKAFSKHDEERFNKYKEALKSGKTKINAEVLFPHDCVRTCKNGDEEIANAQFEALPNYLEKTDQRIIVVCDTSGSMVATFGGSVQAIDVSQGLALYCSSKIPKDNPFYKKFIGFASEGRFVNWREHSFSQAVFDPMIFNGAVGSTRIDKALGLILNSAINWNLTQEQLPSILLIVSDMQFSQGVNSRSKTDVAHVLSSFESYGYTPPKIVYWNLAGYPGSPDTAYGQDVALVSGFSPSILQAILSGTDFTPMGVMRRALEKYQVVTPK